MPLELAQVFGLLKARLVPLADHGFFCHLAIGAHGITQETKHDQCDTSGQQRATNGDGLNVAGAQVEEKIAHQEAPQEDYSG